MEAAGLLPDEVLLGAARVIATQEFFPAPCQVIRAIRPPADEDAVAELAWQRVLECVRRYGGNASLHVSDLDGDGAALWAVERMGWERLCEQLEDSNRAILRAEFIRTLGAARIARLTAVYAPGRFERLNTLQNRTLTPGRVGRPDWGLVPGETKALPAAALEAAASDRGPRETPPLRRVGCST